MLPADPELRPTASEILDRLAAVDRSDRGRQGRCYSRDCCRRTYISMHDHMLRLELMRIAMSGEMQDLRDQRALLGLKSDRETAELHEKDRKIRELRQRLRGGAVMKDSMIANLLVNVRKLEADAEEKDHILLELRSKSDASVLEPHHDTERLRGDVEKKDRLGLGSGAVKYVTRKTVPKKGDVENAMLEKAVPEDGQRL